MKCLYLYHRQKKNEIKGKGKLDTASEFCKAHSLDNEQLSKITTFSSSTGVMFWIIKLILFLSERRRFPRDNVVLIVIHAIR